MREALLEGKVVLDASVLIELLAGNPVMRPLVEAIVNDRVEAYASRLSIVEAFYVTCRLWGTREARERLQVLLDSEMIEIVEDNEIWEQVAECKCRIPISLGDCHTLALAKKYKIKPLFLQPEKELIENQDTITSWLGTQPLYLLKTKDKAR